MYLKNNINFSISVIIDQSNIDYIDELFEDLNSLGKFFDSKIWVTLIEGKHYDNSLKEIDILKSYLAFKERYKMLYLKTSLKILDKLKDYLANEGVTARVCNAGVTKVYDFETGADVIIVTTGRKATVYKGFETSTKTQNCNCVLYRRKQVNNNIYLDMTIL